MFRPPPGAARLPGEPSDAPRQVDEPAMESAVDDLLIGTSWWTAPGSPQQAGAWFTAHGPAGAKPGPWADGDPAGATRSTWSFDLPDRAGFQERTLMMSALPFHGMTLLRVDAMEVHVGERTARDQVPAGVVRLVVSGSTRHAPKPAVLRTVTDPTLIQQVAALTNKLRPAAPGTRSCPNDTGGTLGLTFYSAASSKPVATLLAARSGCRDATITTAQDPAGMRLTTADDYETRVLKLLGLTLPAG